METIQRFRRDPTCTATLVLGGAGAGAGVGYSVVGAAGGAAGFVGGSVVPVAGNAAGAVGGFMLGSGGGALAGGSIGGAVGGIAGSIFCSSSVDLTGGRSKHILEGDQTGGGHRLGTGIQGKSEFPKGWSDAKILEKISDVATDPASKVTLQGKTQIVEGIREGINIKSSFVMERS